MRFSTASTIPSVVQTPTAVDPSCRPLRLVYSGLQTRSWAAKTWEGVTHLDCLYRILDLKQSAFRAKCVYATVVFRSGQEHGAGLLKLFVSETDQAAAHTRSCPNSDSSCYQFPLLCSGAQDHIEPRRFGYRQAMHTLDHSCGHLHMHCVRVIYNTVALMDLSGRRIRSQDIVPWRRPVQTERSAMGKVHYEFGGPVGTLCTTLLTPAIVYALNFLSNTGGCLQLLPLSFPALDTAPRILSWQGIAVAYGWFFGQLLLHALLSAKEKTGVVEPDGTCWLYRLNGVAPLQMYQWFYTYSTISTMARAHRE